MKSPSEVIKHHQFNQWSSAQWAVLGMGRWKVGVIALPNCKVKQPELFLVGVAVVRLTSN